MLAGMLAILAWQTADLQAAEYFLRADTTTLTLPNGSNVVMWGFARDSAFGAMDGTVTVPGPKLTVMPNDSTLTIHLDNRLPEPVSIVIPGQSIVPSPVRMVNGRARSFTTETPPENDDPVDYVWNNLRPGTFLYESGTHPSVQIQMGLYGCIRKDYAAGQAYSNVNFDAEVTLLYSEVDTALHDAVAEDDYGPGELVSSTINYEPKYFLINGQFYTNGMAPAFSGRFGDAVMIHFLNAGLETHVPIVNNAYVKLVAEDGFLYPYPKEQYSVFLPAGKTIDAIFTTTESGKFAVYDRRLYMVNDDVSPGGMLTYLDVESSSINLLLPANGGVLRSYTSQKSSGNGAAKLADNATGSAGYWRSSDTPKKPQEFVYSFSNNSFAVLSRAVIYNYGEGSQNRYSKRFHIDASIDGVNYTVITNGILAANETARTLDLQDVVGRYVRLVVTNGYNNKAWELGEFQVYGTLFTDTTPPVPGSATSPATNTVSPITVSYTGASDTGGSGLARVELWYKKGAGGTWINSGLTWSGASGAFNFTGMLGVDTYYFGLVAVDGAGNRSAAVSGAGDCSTVYTGPVSLRNLVLPANGGVLRSYTSQYNSGNGAAKLADNATGAASYWRSKDNPTQPQEFAYSFSSGNAAVLSHAVIYNFGEGSQNRYSRGFHIDVSSDGVNYTVVTNGVLAANKAAQTFSLQGIAGKYVRLVVTNGYNSKSWELSEFQVFGVFSGSGGAPVGAALAVPEMLKDAGAQMQSAGTPIAAEAVVSWPQVWSSGDWSAKHTAGNLVDGNTNTVWVGKADGAPWAVSVDFGKKMNLADLQILFWDKAWKNTFVGGSVNGTNDWFDVMSTTNSTINVRYLLIEMWYDPVEAAPPAIREIIWK